MSASIAKQSAELRIAVFRLARRLRLEKSSDDLGYSQFGVLIVLDRFGPHTLSMLAERERVSPPSMNRTVNSLEARGLLRRDADTADRRRSHILITEAGAAVVNDTIARRDAWLTSRLRGLSPHDRATLAAAAAILDRLASE